VGARRRLAPVIRPSYTDIRESQRDSGARRSWCPRSHRPTPLPRVRPRGAGPIWVP
jgi:hypothetical protein